MPELAITWERIIVVCWGLLHVIVLAQAYIIAFFIRRDELRGKVTRGKMTQDEANADLRKTHSLMLKWING